MVANRAKSVAASASYGGARSGLVRRLALAAAATFVPLLATGCPRGAGPSDAPKTMVSVSPPGSSAASPAPAAIAPDASVQSLDSSGETDSFESVTPPVRNEDYAYATSGQIVCGTAKCEAGREACCEGVKGSGCRPVIAELGESPGIPGLALPAAATTMACWDEGMTSRVTHCENSSQCPGGAICAVDTPSLDFGGFNIFCHDEVSGAHEAELCQTRDRDCRRPGTICVLGECRKKDRSVRCGHRTCGPREACWGDQGEDRAKTGSCRPRPGMDDNAPHDTCDGPEDCLAGQYCCSGSYQRCMYDCIAGDTPRPLCADHTVCRDLEDAKCDACGARAK